MLRRSLIAGAGATAFVARKAIALTTAQRLLLYSTPPWVLAGASLDFDFENNRYYQQGRPNSIDSLITCSRASTGYVDDILNNWSSIGANLPRIGRGKGLLIEETRTNLALWCRDFTNAVWIKTTLTAALTAIGIDGTANSASTLTATGVAATALQTVVQLSTADTVSFFVKRISGSGVVSVTGDGVSYTDITTSLSANSWFRATISATLVNPVLGIKLATSGDVVAVDFAQLEAGTIATSPILTTTVSVARAIDILTATTLPTLGSGYTLFFKGTPLAPIGYANQQTMLNLNDGTTNNEARIRRINGTGVINGLARSAGVVVTNIGPGVAVGQGSSFKAAFTLTSGSQALAYSPNNFDGVGVGVLPIGMTSLQLGSVVGGTSSFNGYIERIPVWLNTRLSNADLQRIIAL